MNPSKRKIYALLAGVGISIGAAGIASAASNSGSTANQSSVAAAAVTTVSDAATDDATDTTDDASEAADDTAADGAHSANGITETELTGAEASSVTAAVLAAYPDATIDRMETDAEGAAFEAHITMADGSDATVKLDASFAVTATETNEGHGRHGGHGDGDGDGHGHGDDGDGDGPHSANGISEAELTGTEASSVTAAVLAAYPDATIDRMETDAEGAAFEAHITMADGSDATVKLDASFAVTATETDG